MVEKVYYSCVVYDTMIIRHGVLAENIDDAIKQFEPMFSGKFEVVRSSWGGNSPRRFLAEKDRRVVEFGKKKCVVCGRMFSVSRGSDNKTCSQRCYSKNFSMSNVMSRIPGYCIPCTKCGRCCL